VQAHHVSSAPYYLPDTPAVAGPLPPTENNYYLRATDYQVNATECSHAFVLRADDGTRYAKLIQVTGPSMSLSVSMARHAQERLMLGQERRF
jgi:hypothetical protein